MHIKSQTQYSPAPQQWRHAEWCEERMATPGCCSLLRDNLFIILLIPLVAVSAVRSVCVRSVITVVPDAAHYGGYHLLISSTSILYHVIHYFEPVQTDRQL